MDGELWVLLDLEGYWMRVGVKSSIYLTYTSYTSRQGVLESTYSFCN